MKFSENWVVKCPPCPPSSDVTAVKHISPTFSEFLCISNYGHFVRKTVSVPFVMNTTALHKNLAPCSCTILYGKSSLCCPIIITTRKGPCQLLRRGCVPRSYQGSTPGIKPRSQGVIPRRFKRKKNFVTDGRTDERTNEVWTDRHVGRNIDLD